MGLRAAERTALAAGLERLRIIRDMPACLSGTEFNWPNVVFQTADAAGTAVALALQNATCTFTAAPTPPPTPTPTPARTANAVHDIRLTPGDGTIGLAWTPAAGDAPRRSSTTRPAAGPATASGSSRPRASRSSRKRRSAG